MYEITDNERSVRSITNNSAGFVNRILRRVNSLLPKVSGGGGGDFTIKFFQKILKIKAKFY